MAWYKCKASGNEVEFTELVDIKSMLNHDGYVLIEKKEVNKETLRMNKDNTLN